MAVATPPPNEGTRDSDSASSGRPGVRWGLVITILAAILLMVLWWFAATTRTDGPLEAEDFEPAEPETVDVERGA